VARPHCTPTALRIPVENTFTLADAAAAHAHNEAGHVGGRTIITVP
jgi:NADPH:quinone reductase-like Zn-dependent oxidoreductase